jgi:hypothetical protein
MHCYLWVLILHHYKNELLKFPFNLHWFCDQILSSLIKTTFLIKTLIDYW